MKIIRNTLLAVIPLTLLLSCSMTPQLSAQSAPNRIISVTGIGLKNIPTSTAEINLGVEFQGDSATSVQTEVAKRSNAIVELLKSRPEVQRLQTTGLTLNPVYSYEKNVQQLKGYMGTNTVSFRVANDKAGALIDSLIQAGATKINSINFMADDNNMKQAELDALKAATQDAQTQAEAVLKALNLTKKDIVNIQVNQSPTINPPIPLNADTLKAASATPIVGGQQEVKASVTMQISY